jgi:hypothetical protein
MLFYFHIEFQKARPIGHLPRLVFQYNCGLQTATPNRVSRADVGVDERRVCKLAGVTLKVPSFDRCDNEFHVLAVHNFAAGTTQKVRLRL